MDTNKETPHANASQQTPPQTVTNPKPRKALGRPGRKAKRTRTSRPYPSASFEETLELGEAIHKYADGEKIRRLTLMEKMEKSPTSSSTHMLIVNSNKYAITRGNYAAEWLELTELGKTATNPEAHPREKLHARFTLAVDGIKPFKALYEGYKGKKIPPHEVLKDFLAERKLSIENFDECIDLFIVNAKFLGLLRMVAGSQLLIPVDQALDEFPRNGEQALTDVRPASVNGEAKPGPADWGNICFYITPIGVDGSEHRKHADLFLNSIVEPALKDLGLKVVRADKIGAPGMITSQILDHILKAKLVIADLSFQNPNVFYELAVRHASQLPVVHIIRKCDKIPFDVNPFRAIEIDTTDIYALVPQLETIRSQIATFVRNAIADPASAKNPLTVFCPGLKVSLPSASVAS